MKSFIEIMDEVKHLHPVAQQDTVVAMLPGRAAEHGIRLWQPGDPIASEGRRILLGIGEWDRRGLELLDRIVAAGFGHVEIFLLRGKTQEDFEAYIPGIGKVFHSPLIGVWEGGVLVHRGSGAVAHQIISKIENSPAR